MQSFVKRWLGGHETAAVVPFLPPGQRVYCVGDVHGELALLQQLQRMIERDAAGFEGDKTLVYLGDYIDRGPHSREVVEVLSQQPLEGFETVHLMGNHEQTLLDFLQHPRAVASWLSFGGQATLLSYGVDTGERVSRQRISELRDQLEVLLPPGHLAFMQSLKLWHVAGSYCFVHAGIRPGVPLQEQRDEDLLWIREEFTHSAAIHEHIVVHGHSIRPEAELCHNRIGIDTGAFHTGVLTCLVLEGSEQRVLQTGHAD